MLWICKLNDVLHSLQPNAIFNTDVIFSKCQINSQPHSINYMQAWNMHYVLFNIYIYIYAFVDTISYHSSGSSDYKLHAFKVLHISHLEKGHGFIFALKPCRSFFLFFFASLLYLEYLQSVWLERKKIQHSLYTSLQHRVDSCAMDYYTDQLWSINLRVMSKSFLINCNHGSVKSCLRYLKADVETLCFN